MFKTSLRTFGAAILSLAAIASAPSASAAIVTGSWDPDLPKPFVDLGWVATVNMRIDGGCVVDTSNTFSLNVFGRSFGCSGKPENVGVKNFEVLRAQVGLYSTITGRIIEVLEFAPPSGSMDVNLIDLLNNKFELRLGESKAVSAQAPQALSSKFKLAVPGALPVLSYQNSSNPGTFITATNTPFLTRFDVQENEFKDSVLAGTRLTTGQLVAPTAIPEPGSLALVLLALGATGAVAARRSRRTDHIS